MYGLVSSVVDLKKIGLSGSAVLLGMCILRMLVNQEQILLLVLNKNGNTFLLSKTLTPYARARNYS